MTRPAPHPFAAASTLFLVVSTAGGVGFATLYARGVTRLESDSSIGQREVRILARPVRVAVGQRRSKAAVEEHLHRIGYYSGCANEPGCYAENDGVVTIWARYPELPDVTLEWDGDTVSRVTAVDGAPLDGTIIEPETMLTLTTDPAGTISRTISDPIPFTVLSDTALLDAIIASEDRWFLRHHGVDFPRLVLTPIVGGGASTITMQVARLNVLRDRRRTLQRKMNEIAIAMAIERVHSKAAIVNAYANSVYVGSRRGRSLQGFAAAAREFYGIHDVRRLTGVQASTLVALLNQPSRYLDDFHDSDGASLRRQRNRVLRLMHKTFPARYSETWARELEGEPVTFAAPPGSSDVLYRVSRHFLDNALAALPPLFQGRIYLTLDPDLQRIAADVVDQGLTDLERRIPRLATPQLQAALIITNPQTGEVLAMVGGRSYDSSQFNRAIGAERQLGSIMKPFDYLAAFERAAAEKRTDISPSTIVADTPTVFTFGGHRPWRPANYDGDYAGSITWRRALAESRNVAAVKVAAWAGLDRVAALWTAASGQALRHVFPSIALGSLQATPADVARSYAIFATGGVVRPLRTITAGIADGRDLREPDRPQRVAREDATREVADMMRAVLDEGTARGARARGFTLPAAGKTGTTDALRDAWFAGFTGDLLAVVWVGRDDDHPLGLTGAQAALPIWTELMKRAHQER